MRLAGVRKQLEEAKQALTESAAEARAGKVDPAYRLALRSRNLLFHASRGLASARGEELPEMPVSGGGSGGIDDVDEALAALEGALLAKDDAADMPSWLEAAKAPYVKYLGHLKLEVAKLMMSQPR